MKKLFVSVPMAGRDVSAIMDSIAELKNYAEFFFKQPLELIDTYIERECPDGLNNERLWYLGESIKLLAEADYYVGVYIPHRDVAPGCQVENKAAACYGIKRCHLNVYKVCPDLIENCMNKPEMDKEEQ